jgi:hypothetical protein
VARVLYDERHRLVQAKVDYDLPPKEA